MAERDDVLWLHARHEITIVELAECAGLEEGEVRELVEYGALSPTDAQAWTFSADCVSRVRAAARLRADLDLETPTLALVLSFLERIDTLEAQVRNLAAQLQAPRR